jgi:PKD repeat protein
MAITILRKCSLFLIVALSAILLDGSVRDPLPADAADPVADFEIAPADPREGDIVQFVDLSQDPGGSIESHHWTINGEVTTLQNPFYMFEDQGTYSVSLTVTDDVGGQATASRDINVTNAPPLVNALDTETLEGRPAQLRGRFLDAGPPDAHTAEWQLPGSPAAEVEEENEPMLSTGLATGSFSTTEPASGWLRVHDEDGGTGSDFVIVQTVPDDAAARMRHEPNNLPGDGAKLSADSSYISFLQEQGDIDIFEIKQVDNLAIKAGSEMLVTAHGLPADYDIAILAEAPPGAETAGYSRLGLSTLGYSRLGFSETGESVLGYSRLGYSRLGYSRLGYSRLGYSRLGLATFGTSGASWADIGYSRLGYSRLGYSRLGNDVSPIDVTLDDIGLNGLAGGDINVADFSAARGISDETAWARSTEDGTRFYAVVIGANGAHSAQEPYSLSVEIIEPPEFEFDLGPACIGSPLVASGATSATAVLHDYNDPGTGVNDAANSVFVIQEQRFRAVHGLDQAAWDAFLAEMVALAQHASVRGDIISPPSDIYDAWDISPCSVAAANGVTSQIRDIVQSPPYDQAEHLMLLGGDQVVPFWRVQDHAIIGNEKDYLLDSLLKPGSPLYMAIVQGFMLTDHYIADSTLDPWQGGEFPVPDRAVGRLVETPDEIAAAAEAFLDSGGVLAPETAAVSGYDFFDDGADVIADNLSTGIGDVDGELINDAWTAAELRCRMLDIGGDASCRAPDVSAPNAHFTHYAGLSANGFNTDDFDDALSAADVAGAGGGTPVLEGAVVFTMGCHAGLNAPDNQVSAPIDEMDPALDFPQAAARQRAIWVASTGFGIGDDEGIAGTEEIMGVFADDLVNSGLTAGEALTKSLQDYILAQNPLSVYDVKSAVQTTYYGLTMYAVNPQGALAAAGEEPPGMFAAAAVENVGYSFSLTTVDTTSAITSVTSTHPLEPNPTATDGTYYTADGTATSIPRGDAQATMGRAVQPRVVEDLATRHPQPPGAPPANGLIVTAGTYVDLEDFDPLISRRKYEWELGVREPQECMAGFWPSQPIGVNTLRGNPVEQRLVVIPGQFECTNDGADPVLGTERLWTSMTAEIKRCVTTDTIGPVISRVDIQAVAGGSSIDVTASDPSGLARIVALRISGGNVVPFTRTLSGEEEGTFTVSVPTSGLPQEKLYLQVEDTQCNTSVHTAKAGYLSAISVNAGPDREWAPGPQEFTATITGFSALRDDITFTWDFGDGTTLSGVLTPDGASSVPVTVDGSGNGTFTVSHEYDTFPVPRTATIRIDEGLGGSGYDDVNFTADCRWEEGDRWHHGHIDGDDDCDGFPSHDKKHGRGHEEFMGTELGDSCPDDREDDAWPPDFNNSGEVDLSDVSHFGHRYNKHSSHPDYWARFDLTADGWLDLSDLSILGGAFYNKPCLP